MMESLPGQPDVPRWLSYRAVGLGILFWSLLAILAAQSWEQGGLVRAYSDSVRMALEEMPRAKKVSTTVLMFIIPYSLYEQTKIIVTSHDGLIVDENFTADVTLSVRLPDSHLECFKKRMVQLTHGEIELILIEKRSNTIMPLGK